MLLASGRTFIVGKKIESNQDKYGIKSFMKVKNFIDSFQPSIAFYIETYHLISSIDQMTGFNSFMTEAVTI